MTETRDEQLALLSTMLRIRRVEERLSELFMQGKIPGFIHVGIGQEAVAAGVCSWLGARDSVLTTPITCHVVLRPAMSRTMSLPTLRSRSSSARSEFMTTE